MLTRFEGGDRGQVHWTCGLDSLNRGGRDGGGIGEIGEKIDEKTGEMMGGKMGEERCEGERETAQVSSSVGMVVNVQWSQIRDPWLGGGEHTFRAPH